MGGGSRNGRSASVNPHTAHRKFSFPYFSLLCEFSPKCDFSLRGRFPVGRCSPPYVGGGGGGLWNVECGMWMDTVTVDGSYSNIGEKWGILVIFNVPLFF